MATSQQFLVCDNSTVTNFKSWASALSNFIRSAGWTNSSDTGQLNGAGAGNWTGVSTVPGSGLFYYEVFQPGDGLTNFFLKVEYGNSTGSTNSPTVRISASTLTNGAGTLTGLVTTTTQVAGAAYTAPSTTATYECDFSGDSGRLSILLWRTAPNDAPQLFAVQRSLNASGSPVGTYVTLWTSGWNSLSQNIKSQGWQQSLHFVAGPANSFQNCTQNNNSATGWPLLTMTMLGNQISLAFNGSIPVWFLQPCVGIWDYPCTVVGAASVADLSEGVPFTIVNQYGQTKTYIPTRAGALFLTTCTQDNPQSIIETILVEFD